MLPCVCIVRPSRFGWETYLLPPGFRYVIIARFKCYQILPSSVERWVHMDSEWTMNRYHQEIRKLHESHQFVRVVFAGSAEVGVLPALIMNHVLGLGGLPYTSFVALRDKAIMLKKMMAAGVPVPKFCVVETYIDFYEFAQKQKFPFLVKPTMDAGASGIAIIRNAHQLDSYCRNLPTKAPGSRNFNLICQEFINVLNMYQVNGVADGQHLHCCYPCKLPGDVLTALNATDPGPFSFPSTVRTLASHEKMFQPLIRYTQKVLTALNVPAGHPFVYHLEIMVDEEKRLYFCEIAGRLGGGVNPSLMHTKIDFWQTIILGQLGQLHGSVPACVEEQPVPQIFTILWLGIKPGTTVHLMNSIDMKGGKRSVSELLMTLPVTIPSTQPIAQTSNILQHWLVESESPGQAESDIADLMADIENACVYSFVCGDE